MRTAPTCIRKIPSLKTTERSTVHFNMFKNVYTFGATCIVATQAFSTLNVKFLCLLHFPCGLLSSCPCYVLILRLVVVSKCQLKATLISYKFPITPSLAILSYGNLLLQCSAISLLVGIQTSFFFRMYLTNSFTAVKRPGFPLTRQCKPIDIIFGFPSLPSAYKTSNELFRYSRNADVEPQLPDAVWYFMSLLSYLFK